MTAAPAPGRLRTALPALLLSAVLASGVSLWALGHDGDDAGDAGDQPARAQAVSVERTEPAPPAALPVQDPATVVDRASRSRRTDVAAIARQRLAVAKVRKARADRAALLAKQAAEKQRLYGTACPVPDATFVDSWGFARSGGRAHKGTDLMASTGTPIYAVRSGYVKTESSSNGGISLYLTDVEGDRYFYAHNSENLVSSGTYVTVGDLIARVGDTGNARGGPSHLHFELQPGGGGAVRSYSFLREIC